MRLLRLSNFLTTSQNIRIAIAADQAKHVSSQQQNLYFRMPSMLIQIPWYILLARSLGGDFILD